MKGLLVAVSVVALAMALLPATPTARAALSGAPAQLATGLATPWEITPLPDGRVLVTELPGRVRLIQNGALQPTPVLDEDAAFRKLLGLALDPNFASNGFVYLYIGYGSGCSSAPATTGCKNRVTRYSLSGNSLGAPVTIFDNIASDGSHDGGRIKFGPDGKLYVTTGDIHNPALPPDLGSLNGKIFRLNADGSAPADNPFFGQSGKRGEIYSYGHRHPQGLAWNGAGELYASEHGPSGESYAGGQCCRDEVNKIVAGGNYGWPNSRGSSVAAGTIGPIIHSGDSTTWAPSGAAFGPDGQLYVPTLSTATGGHRLRAFTISGGAVTGQNEYYVGTYGRLRTTTADDGNLYFATSNGNDAVYKVAFTGAFETYRFWSPRQGNAHFYTQSMAERDNLIQNDNNARGGNWVYEGVGYNTLKPNGQTCSSSDTAYRFFSPNFRSHFYTSNTAERDRLINNDRYGAGGNWVYENVAYCAESGPGSGRIALHRFFSPTFKKHFFTASEAEKQQLINNDPNWTYESVAHYVF